MQVVEGAIDTDRFNDYWAYTEIDTDIGVPGFRQIQLFEDRYRAPEYNIDCLGRLVTQKPYDGEIVSVVIPWASHPGGGADWLITCDAAIRKS